MDLDEGSTPLNSVIYILSGEMECLGDGSVEDLGEQSDAEEEEIALLTQCVERQTEVPATRGRAMTMKLPENKHNTKPERCVTQRLSSVTGPSSNAG